MPQYRYIKATRRLRSTTSFVRPLSWLFLTLGSSILLWTIWPILSFSLLQENFLSSSVNPVKDETDNSPRSLSPIAFAAGSDFTNINAWYPTTPQKTVVTPVNTYELTIDTLKIKNALVTIGGNDLSESLVHYGGTALPGEYGTTVIFGHSTLPQFFDAKNYKTIFSFLPTMKIGDNFVLRYDGIDYTYTIFAMAVHDPTDLSVLEQKFDDSYVTLVTCVPPGTYWKRLYVQAKLSKLKQ